MLASSTRPSVTLVVTKKLLAIQRGTGESTDGSRPSAVSQPSVVNGSGISDTGLATRRDRS